MFQRILVPLDGSVHAERAIPLAAYIARAFHGAVMMVSVVSPPVRTGKYSVLEEYPTMGPDEEQAEATEYLKIVAASDYLSGIPVETHTLSGASAPTLLDAVTSLHADLIVLCSHGATGFTQWPLGSVAHKLVRYSPVPLLLLPDTARVRSAKDQHPVRVLVALDGSPFSETVLEPAAALTAGLAQMTKRRGTLQLLRVMSIPTRYNRFGRPLEASAEAKLRAEIKQRDAQYLEAVAKRLAEGKLEKYHLDVTTMVATDPNVAQAIVHTAEQDLVDVVAMTTHGWGGVLRWALGSVMERVLHKARTPLLIVRPPAE